MDADKFVVEISKVMMTASRVFICGNGGSAANAMHIANDLISVGVRAHALTSDIATLTAIANDYGYEHVFSKQLQVLAMQGDIVVVLSGSGKSRNILEAIEVARTMGVYSVAVIGQFGDVAMSPDSCIRLGADMQSAEEGQIWFGHSIMRAIKSIRGVAQ